MKSFTAIILLGAVMLALAASLRPTQRTANEPEPGELIQAALTGESGKFGPTIEAVLPTTKSEATVDKLEILDLETGRAMLQPPLEEFDSQANAVMSWIRSNRLDISCSIWPDGAACVTYNMTLVAGDTKSWEATSEEFLSANPALAPAQHSPRRLLVLGPDRPNTYMFRTVEGTLGILQMIGLSPDGQGVRIRYKLINPGDSLSAAL
ncbi:MAG TPA: hypothetical protein VFZ59_09540 [Verrucomicrobiae bacterium]|nr:hypothetical protein [Verrucomicrobiae bacterium]